MCVYVYVVVVGKGVDPPNPRTPHQHNFFCRRNTIPIVVVRSRYNSTREGVGSED